MSLPTTKSCFAVDESIARSRSKSIDNGSAPWFAHLMCSLTSVFLRVRCRRVVATWRLNAHADEFGAHFEHHSDQRVARLAHRMLHSSSSSSSTTSTTTASSSNNDRSSIVDAKIADARAKYDAVVQLLRNSGGKIRNSRSRSVCAVVRSRWLAVQNTDAADNNIDVVKCQRLSQAITSVVFLFVH